MIRKMLVVAALAATALMALPTSDAEARRGGGFRGSGMRAAPAVRARVIGVRPVIVRRPVRIIRRGFVGPVIISRPGRCAWLRQRALVTGSPYWWRRYRLCRGF